MVLRNECLKFYSGFMGEWLRARNKQIACFAKRFWGHLFVQHSVSFPMNSEKKDTHSLYLQYFQQRQLGISFLINPLIRPMTSCVSSNPKNYSSNGCVSRLQTMKTPTHLVWIMVTSWRHNVTWRKTTGTDLLLIG